MLSGKDNLRFGDVMRIGDGSPGLGVRFEMTMIGCDS